MREILFRAKRVDNGEWIEGYFIKARWYIDNHEIVGIMPLDLALYPHSEFSEYYEVIPETAGQYTGLTDKNGKKIFEGDILAFGDRLVYVRWHDYCGCWDCSYIKATEGKVTLREDRSPNKWRYNAEVIGNIHDNPELLEEDV